MRNVGFELENLCDCDWKKKMFLRRQEAWVVIRRDLMTTPYILIVLLARLLESHIYLIISFNFMCSTIDKAFAHTNNKYSRFSRLSFFFVVMLV